MKFYETHYDDYYQSVEKANIHPELVPLYDKFPKTLESFENLIIYGPPGCGKYSQMLYLLKRYSHSQLKYEKKLTVITEKQQHVYKISDIHYEVDMSLLGCNSKLLWHELYVQVVDIVAIKSEKVGIIVCKQFHAIHNELLENFYSYMQQYRSGSGIKIKFVLLTEHLSFIPNNILNSCYILNVKRPSKTLLKNAVGLFKPSLRREKMHNILDQVCHENVINLKELYGFSLLDDVTSLPKDNFNIVCDKIIEEMIHWEAMSLAHFRDILYEILIYNLDVVECVWYVFSYFVKSELLRDERINTLMEKIYVSLKQFGNNYRAIFHLENLFFCILHMLWSDDE